MADASDAHTHPYTHERESTVRKVAHAVLQALVVAVALTLAGPAIVREVARVSPTCAEHPGLVPVPVAAQLLEERAKATSAPVAEQRFAPERAFDSRVVSTWAAPVERPKATTVAESLERAVRSEQAPLAVLRLTLPDRPDVRLLCVVNGLPLDPLSYRRADRVRRVDAVLSCTDEPVAVVLRSMPGDQIYDRQDVPAGCGEAAWLELRVREVYPGESITDPATGERVPPTQLVALSEVTLYRPAERGEPGWNWVSVALDKVRQAVGGVTRT